MKYVYWIDQSSLDSVKELLKDDGWTAKEVRLTPCETMKAADRTVLLASPGVFNGMCGRQGAWYRKSKRNGQFLQVSQGRLPAALDRYCSATYSASSFVPAAFPDDREIEELVNTSQYQEQRPPEWELIGLKDAVMMKVLFTLIRIWKRGDNLKKYWPKHCATHANFLVHRFTTEIDGEPVPYSVSKTEGICSSCVETFNIISEQSRKLAAPCPGAVRFGKAEKDIFLDIRPVVEL